MSENVSSHCTLSLVSCYSTLVVSLLPLQITSYHLITPLYYFSMCCPFCSYETFKLIFLFHFQFSTPYLKDGSLGSRKHFGDCFPVNNKVLRRMLRGHLFYISCVSILICFAFSSPLL